MAQETAERLSDLRAAIKEEGLSGMVVPICDEHMSEYVGDYAQRLAWLTGFKGSAGSAVVLLEEAAMFTDGRYTSQVREQVPEELFSYQGVPETSPVAWLCETVKSGDKIGFDPWLHPEPWAKQAQTKLAEVGAELVPLARNLIDAIWEDQPPWPAREIVTHPVTYAGKERGEKLRDIASELLKKRADACVIASLDGVAWALNLRGRDIAHSPVAFGFLIVDSSGGGTLCMQCEEMEPQLLTALRGLLKVVPYEDFSEKLAHIAEDSARILLDPATAVSAVFQIVEDAGGTVVRGREPVTLPKACKNQVEQDGARSAHLRDGTALTQFLHWFDDTAPKGGLTEINAADALAKQRAKCNLFRDLSFRTISAAGPHAALPHYSVTPESNIEIPVGSLYLVDSGGQYLDGTTDVTRTIAVGDVDSRSKARYTEVLKGHIAVATARFPAGTPGRAIDTFARAALWQSGADYDHGTGHGVGSFLNVHEGPQRIAKAGSDEPLQPGMIVSNEPGYYLEDGFGIRIENLVLVVEDRRPGDERDMLAFETLTLAPIDLRPVDREKLTADEIKWVNAYHDRVRDALTPRVDDKTQSWLKNATAPI